MTTSVTSVDVVVIGGGQAGLATAFYLRRAGLEPGRRFVVLDGASAPGGAWAHMWDGLRLFSPAAHSSLPGWMMPPWPADPGGYPPREHVVDYLTRYEERYELPVLRPHRVTSVSRADDSPEGQLLVRTSTGTTFAARAVVSATGTWGQPFRPVVPGGREFRGEQLHTVDYHRPEDLTGRRVVVVGGGNSAAQILAEVSEVAHTTWVTSRPPRFLPDDVDGRDLFAAATERIRARAEGRHHAGVGGLGDIVMVPPVRRARDRGVLVARPMFRRMEADGVVWQDGSRERVDTVLWCTGFRPALRHLASLRLDRVEGHPRVGGPSGTEACSEPRLHLVGYGDWTGAASATLIGVGRTSRATAAAVVDVVA